MFVYIVQYHGPKVFKKKKDAKAFINKISKGCINYCEEQYNGKKYTRNPIKVKVK